VTTVKTWANMTGNDLMVIFEKPKVEGQSWPAPASPAEPATS
jgi:hypothetical protein